MNTKYRSQHRSFAQVSAAIAATVFCALAAANVPLRLLADPAAPAPDSPPTPNARDYIDDAEKMLVGPIDKVAPDQPAQAAAAGDYVALTLRQRDLLLSQNLPAFNTLEAGLKLAYFAHANDTAGAFTTYQKDRLLARALRFAGDTRAEHGDWDGALKYYFDIINLGVDIPKGSNLISLLVGVAVEQIGQGGIRYAIPNLNSRQAVSAAANLSAIDIARAPFYESLISEKKSTQVALSTYLQSNPSLTASNTPASIETTYSTLMDQAIAIAKLPWPTMIAQNPPTPPGNPIFSTVMLDFRSAQFVVDNSITNSRFLETELALQSFKLTDGHYPATLAHLVPASIQALPLDPFSANQPLKYKLQTDGYQLYSIGPDAVDDGGTPVFDSSPDHKAHPYKVWSYAEKGDIVAGVNDL